MVADPQRSGSLGTSLSLLYIVISSRSSSIVIIIIIIIIVNIIYT